MTAIGRRMRTLAMALGAAAVLGAPLALAQGEPKVLRVVPHSNLSILDPIWTPQYMARNHGYMIYDTLFGTDEKSKIQPQMVESWTISPDKRLYSFTLRPGLEFHDGKPVTGEDVIASLARWGKRDAMGKKLFTFVQKMDSPKPNQFRIFLGEACGFVLEALGKPSSNVPFIMPKRVADTDAFKQIEDYTGSGPYIFKRDEYHAGDKAVYLKNPKYQPRKEPPSGTAGGKRVYVDRVEWNLALRDPQSQVNAIAKGEVDILEEPAFESNAALKADPNVTIVASNPLGFQFEARFNHLYPPFNNAKVSRAAIAAMNQEAFLKAQIGIKEYYHTCPSMFTCGTPYGVTNGSDIQAKSNMKKAQELLKASGYDGTAVVILKPTDLAVLGKLPDVAAQLLRQAGFKVDLQSMDWNTLMSRLQKKNLPSEGGWNLHLTARVSAEISNPLTNAFVSGLGEKAMLPGSSSDEELEKLGDQFARATNDVKKKSLVEAIQARAFEIGTHAPLGEYILPAAVRKGVTGLVTGPGNFYWNIKKQ